MRAISHETRHSATPCRRASRDRMAACAIAATLAVGFPLAGTDAAAASPPKRDAGVRLSGFHSTTLDLAYCSLRIDATSHPVIVLAFANPSNRPLWLRALFLPPGPGEECEVAGRLGPGKEIPFQSCELESLRADSDYPVIVTVYADSAFTDTVEIDTAAVRFGRPEVEMLTHWVEATVLPRTYGRVLLREKFGAMSPLLVGLGGAGTLKVSPDGIEYRRKQRVVELSRAQLAGVTLRQDSRSTADRWVVVEYLAEGTTRTLAFQPASGGQTVELDYIHASLVALLGSTGRAP